MRNRVFRSIAAILSITVLTGVPAQAGPIVINQVIQVLSSPRSSPEIRLRNFSQNSNTAASGIKGSVQGSASDVTDVLLSEPVVNRSDTLLSGITIKSDPQKTVEVIDQGDVEGTVCDCGEILIPGGGFPKWPLLFLAAIPFFFIHGCDDCDELPPSTRTPTPPVAPAPNSLPPGVPEPTSLLLFVTGLTAFGAGLRRRYAKGKLEAQIKTEED